jgi:hypothetical protein
MQACPQPHLWLQASSCAQACSSSSEGLNSPTHAATALDGAHGWLRPAKQAQSPHTLPKLKPPSPPACTPYFPATLPNPVVPTVPQHLVVHTAPRGLQNKPKAHVPCPSYKTPPCQRVRPASRHHTTHPGAPTTLAVPQLVKEAQRTYALSVLFCPENNHALARTHC